MRSHVVRINAAGWVYPMRSCPLFQNSGGRSYKNSSTLPGSFALYYSSSNFLKLTFFLQRYGKSMSAGMLYHKRYLKLASFRNVVILCTLIKIFYGAATMANWKNNKYNK